MAELLGFCGQAMGNTDRVPWHSAMVLLWTLLGLRTNGEGPYEEGRMAVSILCPCKEFQGEGPCASDQGTGGHLARARSHQHMGEVYSVSYTHLTLPTKRIV